MFSFNWHLCKVLIFQGFFAKYFQNLLIDHASIPCASLDGLRGKGSRCSLMVTWKNIANQHIIKPCIHDHFFGGEHQRLISRFNENRMVLTKKRDKCVKNSVLACKSVKHPWFYAHFQTSKCVKIARFPHATRSPFAHSSLVPHPFTVPVIEHVVEESLA